MLYAIQHVLIAPAKHMTLPMISVQNWHKQQTIPILIEANPVAS
jgi:hypothetical protein